MWPKNASVMLAPVVTVRYAKADATTATTSCHPKKVGSDAALEVVSDTALTKDKVAKFIASFQSVTGEVML